MLLLGNSGRHVTLKLAAITETKYIKRCLEQTGQYLGAACHESQNTKGSVFLKFHLPIKKQQQQQQQQQQQNKESWRKVSLHVVTRDIVVDASFRKQIEEGSVFICERHFTPEDIEIRKSQSFSYLFFYENNLFESFKVKINIRGG